jgi:hypothetical protein
MRRFLTRRRRGQHGCRLSDATLRPVSDAPVAGSVSLEELLLADADEAELITSLRHA